MKTLSIKIKMWQILLGLFIVAGILFYVSYADTPSTKAKGCSTCPKKFT